MIHDIHVDPGLSETVVTIKVHGTFKEQARDIAGILLAVPSGEIPIDTTGIGLVLAEFTQDEVNKRLRAST